MKVIVEDHVQLGSGQSIYVYELDPNKSEKKQLQDLINADKKWFKSAHIEIDEYEVNDTNASIGGGDYSIGYHIVEVKKQYI